MKKQGKIQLEIQQFQVQLNSLAPIMFDQFYDHSKAERPPEEKLYLNDKQEICLPDENIRSFLVAQRPKGAIRLFESKAAEGYIRIAETHISIKSTSGLIPFTRNGKPLVFDGFESGSILRVDVSSPVTHGSGGAIIKQPPKKRPVLDDPWSLTFVISLVKNAMIDRLKIENYFIIGGVEVGLGTWRPRYGRFWVEEWKRL